MDVGTVSPDGHYQWNGTKWIPVQLTKVSDDGFWMWNGSDWMPNPNLPFEKETRTEQEKTYSSRSTCFLDKHTANAKAYANVNQYQ